MSDYISREDAKKVIAVSSCLNEASAMISNIPPADVVPVRHGNWLNDFCGKGRFSKRIVQCSLCGNFLDMDGVNAGRGDANFCPNCGAKMAEEE